MIAAHDAIIFSKEKLSVKKKGFFTTSVGNAEYEKVKGKGKKNHGSGGIRTHATFVTGALNQRLRPLGHATI